MSLELLQNKIDALREKIIIIQKDLNNLDYAINNVESPDDAALLAGLFDRKVGEFNKLQEQFKKLLAEYNEISERQKNVVSFTAKKILKAIS